MEAAPRSSLGSSKGGRVTVRKNIILQYSAATFLIVIAVSVALGITLTRRIENYQISSHASLYPEISRLTVTDDAEVHALFAASVPAAVTPRLADMFRRFLSL